MSKVINIAKKTAVDTVNTAIQMTATVAVVSPALATAQIVSNAVLHTGVKPGTVIKQTAIGAVSIIAATAATSIVVNGISNTVSEIKKSKNSVKTEFSDDDEFDDTVEVEEVTEE